MKNIGISIAALTLALASGSAFAADQLTQKAPFVVAAPAPMWTGVYAGLNAGGTWANSNSAQWSMYPAYVHPNSTGAVVNAQVATVIGSPQLSLGSQLGFLGGGQIGYSHQFSRNFVGGIEADIQGAAGASGSGQVFQAATYTFTSSATRRPITQTMYSDSSVQKSLDYLGTVRGKIGYLVTPTLQVYGTGGFAYGGVTVNSFAWQTNMDRNVYNIGPGSSSASSTNVGWTAGGGIEWMFASSWSLKAEYLYYDLGTKKQSAGIRSDLWSGVSAAPGLSTGDYIMATSAHVSTRLNGSIARAGVNYHFNLGAAPVVAKF